MAAVYIGTKFISERTADDPATNPNFFCVEFFPIFVLNFLLVNPNPCEIVQTPKNVEHKRLNSDGRINDVIPLGNILSFWR